MHLHTAIILTPVAAFTLPVVAKIVQKGVGGDLHRDTMVACLLVTAFTLPGMAGGV
jgi:hypothetical protein